MKAGVEFSTSNVTSVLRKSQIVEHFGFRFFGLGTLSPHMKLKAYLHRSTHSLQLRGQLIRLILKMVNENFPDRKPSYEEKLQREQ